MPWNVRQNEEINISNAKYAEGNLKHHSQSKHIICFCKENIPTQNAIQIYSKSKLRVKSCWHMLDNICFPCLFNLNLNLFRLFLVIIFLAFDSSQQKTNNTQIEYKWNISRYLYSRRPVWPVFHKRHSLRPAVKNFSINAYQILWFLAKTGHLQINGNLDEDEISLSIEENPERNYDQKIMTKTDLNVLKRWSPLNIHVG